MAQFFCASFLHASLSFCALDFHCNQRLIASGLKLLATFFCLAFDELVEISGYHRRGFPGALFSELDLECPRPPAAVCMSSRLFVLYVDQRVAV